MFKPNDSHETFFLTYTAQTNRISSHGTKTRLPQTTSKEQMPIKQPLNYSSFIKRNTSKTFKKPLLRIKINLTIIQQTTIADKPVLRA